MLHYTRLGGHKRDKNSNLLLVMKTKKCCEYGPSHLKIRTVTNIRIKFDEPVCLVRPKRGLFRFGLNLWEAR
jgi:hypothetical protein